MKRTHSWVINVGCIRRAVGERGDEIVIGQTGSELEHVLSLPEPVSTEFIANRPGHSNCARSAALGFLKPDAAIHLLGTGGYRNLPRREIDISPPECGNLASAHAAEDGQQTGMNMRVPRTASISAAVWAMS